MYFYYTVQKRPKVELEKGCQINVLHVKIFSRYACLFLIKCYRTRIQLQCKAHLHSLTTLDCSQTV